MQNGLPEIPGSFQGFSALWLDPQKRAACLDLYQRGTTSFIPGLLPEQAVQLGGSQTLDLLTGRFGRLAHLALEAAENGASDPAELPAELRSPVFEQTNGAWLQQANMVGINVRTLGSFWNVVKYALTLPAATNSIHLLPIWEPGVVGSMYGMVSWNLNPEFYSEELAALHPGLHSLESQLLAVVHLLHLMGKTVGMDVIPHTDRFSEIVLAYPEYFEWLQRKAFTITNHSARLHEAIQEQVILFLQTHGPAIHGLNIPRTRAEFFNEQIDETTRTRTLFGEPSDFSGRLARRRRLIRQLYKLGYEPVPATMAPPYRGLEVDPRPEARVVDADGLEWRDYRILEPQPMSRVFGPLARYKLYEPLDDNARWELDFSQPLRPVWEYVCRNYAAVQQAYGFDFMRGDMAHVQMRPDGVPDQPDAFYDILGAVKTHIQKTVPYFGYFAETFLAPRDVMGYGQEMDHLEAAHADTTLGDLQSMVVGSPQFLQQLRYYLDLKDTRRCTPNFTVMTADKDDPRFDVFYQSGNELRVFLSLFLTDMPSYTGLGFETRDIHIQPAPNEHYTKLYVFHEVQGPKATHGPYVWGRNAALFGVITRLRLLAETLLPAIQQRPVRWLIPPDPAGQQKPLAWTQQGQPGVVFIANASPNQEWPPFGLPLEHGLSLKLVFSTKAPHYPNQPPLAWNGFQYAVPRLAPAEGRVYQVETAALP